MEYELECVRCSKKYPGPPEGIKWNPELYNTVKPKHDCLRDKWYSNSETILRADNGAMYRND